jgi:hypothetical protein
MPVTGVFSRRSRVRTNHSRIPSLMLNNPSLGAEKEDQPQILNFISSILSIRYTNSMSLTATRVSSLNYKMEKHKG